MIGMSLSLNHSWLEFSKSRNIETHNIAHMLLLIKHALTNIETHYISHMLLLITHALAHLIQFSSRVDNCVLLGKERYMPLEALSDRRLSKYP